MATRHPHGGNIAAPRPGSHQAQAGAPVTLRADALPFNPFGAAKEAPAAAQAQVGAPFAPRADALRFNPSGAVKVMRREHKKT